MPAELPETVNGATLVWNHEHHYVVANGGIPEHLFVYDDGTDVVETVIVGVGAGGRWLCPACVTVLTEDICACRFPTTDNDPY